MSENTAKMGNRFINLVGRKFGRLTVVSLNKEKSVKRIHWNCICDCKTDMSDYTIVAANQLSSGKTQSCGCLKNERWQSSYKKRAQEAKDKLNSKLKTIDAEILGEYKNNITPVSVRFGELIIDKRLVDIHKIFKTILRFKKLIADSGDVFIRYSGYTNIGISMEILTFDGAVLDMKFGDYQRFVKSRSGFLKSIKDKGHSYSGSYYSSHGKVLIDYKCGHLPSMIKPTAYVGGVNCPKCEKNSPEQSRIDFEEMLMNNGHTLLTPYTRNNRKVLVDFNCGHTPHLMTPNGYKNGHRCPYCSESRGETVIREYLNKNFIKNKKEFSIKTGNLIMDLKKYDIYIPKYRLIVEVHGRQHYEEVDFFKNRTLAEEQENDRLKKEYAISNKYNYMVIDYREHIPKIALKRFINQFEEFLLNYKDIT